MKPDADNVSAIRNAPRLIVPEISYFYVGFYRKLVPNFDHIALPLTDLMKEVNKVQQQWFGKIIMNKHFKLCNLSHDFKF